MRLFVTAKHIAEAIKTVVVVLINGGKNLLVGKPSGSGIVEGFTEEMEVEVGVLAGSAGSKSQEKQEDE